MKERRNYEVVDIERRDAAHPKPSRPESDVIAPVIPLRPTAEPPEGHTPDENLAYIQTRMGIPTKKGARDDAVDSYAGLLRRLEDGGKLYIENSETGDFTEIIFNPPTK